MVYKELCYIWPVYFLVLVTTWGWNLSASETSCFC